MRHTLPFELLSHLNEPDEARRDLFKGIQNLEKVGLFASSSVNAADQPFQIGLIPSHFAESFAEVWVVHEILHCIQSLTSWNQPYPPI